MQDLPHRYLAMASAEPAGEVCLDSQRLARIRSAAPAEFGGPGDRWSPETLLTGALADCLVLTFRAVASASKVAWIALRIEADGTLDRIDRATQFTRFDLRARLQVPAGTNVDQARRALEKAEHNCLISNSLKATIHLEIDIQFAAQPNERPQFECATTP